jgi:hypothetical protein
LNTQKIPFPPHSLSPLQKTLNRTRILQENIVDIIEFSPSDVSPPTKPTAPPKEENTQEIKLKGRLSSKFQDLYIDTTIANSPVYTSVKYDRCVRQIGQEIFPTFNGKQFLILDRHLRPFCKKYVPRNKNYAFTYHKGCFFSVMGRVK